jgi:hypothetical protein
VRPGIKRGLGDQIAAPGDAAGCVTSGANFIKIQRFEFRDYFASAPHRHCWRLSAAAVFQRATAGMINVRAVAAQIPATFGGKAYRLPSEAINFTNARNFFQRT